MNRLLIVPAGCCLVAFAALWASLGGAAGKESRSGALAAAGDNASTAAATKYSRSPALPAGSQALALEEVEQSLTALTGEYMRPWRQHETSPRYLLSRAAPRQIPSISAEVELAAGTNAPSEGLAVGTIFVSRGTHFETFPCAVDRYSGHTRLFAGGQWLTASQWVAQAPLPN